MQRWRKAWGIALAALLIVQTIARMVGHHLAFHTSKLGDLLHLLMIAAWLGFVALVVWWLPRRIVKWPIAAIAFTLLMGGAHAIATYTDIFHLIWYHYVHWAAPVWLPFEDPALSLSLMISIGVPPLATFGIVLLILIPHLLLYAMVADGAVDWIKRVMSRPLPIRLVMGRVVPIGVLAGAPLAVAALVTALMPPLLWRYEMLHRASRSAFQMAPTVVMMAPPPDGPAPPVVAARRPRPLVLIIVDALRRDRMGVYNPPLANTPFLESLQHSGKMHVYSGYSPCTLSYCGILSVLASRSWDQFVTRPPTIMDALAHHGYQNHVILTGYHEGFGNLTRQYGRGIVQLWDTGPTADADDRLALKTLAGTRFDDPNHSFLYLHLDSAHAGSVIEPEFDRGSWPAVPYARVYDARVRQADAKLRDTFAILRKKGLLAHALVIITADHGERLGENGMLFHGGAPDQPSTAVPVIVYDDDGAAWPEHPLVSTLDVAPTLVGGIGGIAGKGWRGLPLQDPRSRVAAPLATGDYTGAVAALDGHVYRYLCARDSAREIVRLDGPALAGPRVEGAELARVLPQLRRLHREVTSVGCGR